MWNVNKDLRKRCNRRGNRRNGTQLSDVVLRLKHNNHNRNRSRDPLRSRRARAAERVKVRNRRECSEDQAPRHLAGDLVWNHNK